jgi:hypothetical protein
MFEKHAFKITTSANFAPRDANDCTLMMRFQNKDDDPDLYLIGTL